MLIHPRELEIPKMEDVGVAAIKAFPEDAEKLAEDIKKLKITLKKVTQDIANEILMDFKTDVSLDDKKESEAVGDQNFVKALVRQESSDY